MSQYRINFRISFSNAYHSKVWQLWGAAWLFSKHAYFPKTNTNFIKMCLLSQPKAYFKIRMFQLAVSLWQNFGQNRFEYQLHIGGCKSVKYQQIFLLFYAYHIIKAIFNHLNLCSSQKSWTVESWNSLCFIYDSPSIWTYWAVLKLKLNIMSPLLNKLKKDTIQ